MNKTNMEIQNVLNENKLNDLKRFISRREQLNSCNVKLRYLHYITHYSSILITSIAVSYQNESAQIFIKLVWTGLTMNILSSLIGSFEKMNKSISNKLLSDIYKIRSDKYVDECEMIDSFHENNSSKSNTTNYQKVLPI